MFFKRRKSKDRQEKQTIEEKIKLEAEKMPIITLDNAWHQLVGEIKTPEIEALEKELNQLLKEQGKFNTDYIEYTRMKKEMLDNILELTHQAFEEKSEKAMEAIEKQQKMVLKINEKLQQIEPVLDGLPEKIQQTNNALINMSVNLCYEKINHSQEKSSELDEEIQKIRSILMKKTEEKKAYDKQSEQLYRYLHQLVGPSFIEKLDHLYWEET